MPNSRHVVAAGQCGGYHVAFVVGALLVLASIAVAVTVLAPERRAAVGPHPGAGAGAAEPAAAEA